MKIEIAEHGRMTESGSSLLRLIQNQDIPLLDLLVREAVQNSLDAGKNSSEPVNIDISVAEFSSQDLNKHLEKIEQGLNRRFQKRICKYIAVRDSNTTGLTGPIRYTEVQNNNFGNLLKLVYEICKPQTNEGAGGSWGLGKTIYFRLGIGLVFYYSRIFQNGRYQSRLAACLVEDETKSDALIPNSAAVKRGIAWWGNRDGLMSKNTVPIESEQEIEKILRIFGIRKYENDETGTTVIVPYIDEKELLNEVYALDETESDKPYWVSSVEDYLKVAIQRWYAPRLSNASYPYGSFLLASVNGNRIKVSEMLPAFRYIRELYILATDREPDDECMLSEQKVEYYKESIDLRNVLNTTSSGKFAYAKFNRQQLQMEPPFNQKAPYQQLDNVVHQTENGNGPIISYTRRPGMIVGYDFDGPWTHRMPKTKPDEFIIGIFVANSTNVLRNITDTNTGEKMILEEYIRQGEKADHASWTDRNIGGNNPRIISNIQKHVINKIKKRYTEAEKPSYERQNIGLGHALADMLLPESDFGNIPTPPSELSGNSSGRKNGGNARKSSKKSRLHILSGPEYADGSVKFNIEIHLKGRKCLLYLQVLTDFKRFDANTWEEADELGKPFPLEFREFRIKQIQRFPKTKKNCYDCNLAITIDNDSASDSNVSIAFIKSDIFSTNSYVEVKPGEAEIIITGEVSFIFKDGGIKGSLEIKES